MRTRATLVGSAALLAAALGLLVPGRAAAQPDLDEDDYNWRQANRPEVPRHRKGFDLEHFAFELRFGPYWPEVDEEFSASPGPYEEIFDTDARFYFGLELDWLPFRIPYVGCFGPAFGWGYTSSSANAIVVSTGERADSDTTLTILPMHISGAARFDSLLYELGVPVVPYLKMGLGFGLWTASGPSGTSTVDGVEGKGTSLGLHFAPGAMLALSELDRRASVAMREDAGIEGTYLFGEWMWANLDGIGSHPQMHVGTSTVVVGLALEW